MKRDMDLIRRILLDFEEKGMPEGDFNIEGVEEDTLDLHIELLIEAGYINGKSDKYGDGRYMPFILNHITWEGYELLDDIRDEGIWSKIKDKMKVNSGSVSIPILQQLAGSLIKQAVGL